MKNLRVGFLFALLALLSLSVQAQPAHNGSHKFDPDQMKAKKISRVIAELSLTDDQQAKFKPLYEARESEKIALFKQRKEKVGAIRESQQELKEADYAQFNSFMIDLNLKEANIEKNYYDKFTKILNSKQLYNMYKQEREMMRDMARKFEQRKGQHSDKAKTRSRTEVAR